MGSAQGIAAGAVQTPVTWQAAPEQQNARHPARATTVRMEYVAFIYLDSWQLMRPGTDTISMYVGRGGGYGIVTVAQKGGGGLVG